MRDLKRTFLLSLFLKVGHFGWGGGLGATNVFFFLSVKVKPNGLGPSIIFLRG